ncbi:MAG: hypothetical protein JWP01_2580 [Myxococcales bacterium]|nr:hypothetical protein [Myxococcales bacterium]
MGTLGAGVVIAATLVVLASPARADDAPLVNLLTSVPSTIAVSSTVDNVKIRPEHIADGKLETAWNAATGQILGAWVEVRVPAGTHIKQIKLTPGFSVVDKKHGDLFTKNARIKKLRLYHAGRPIKDITLDATRRDLQTIDVALTGGDLRLEVIAAEPGSKKTWREACISELEVWGTLAAGTIVGRMRAGRSLRRGQAPPAARAVLRVDRRGLAQRRPRQARDERQVADRLLEMERLALPESVTVLR